MAKETVRQNPEGVSENYFERVNAEFERMVKSGDVLKGKDVLKEIAVRNEESFFGKVVDAVKNPKEALKWLKRSVLSALAGSWLLEKMGIKDVFAEAKERVMEVLDNPVRRLRKTLREFEGFGKLREVGFKAGEVLGKGTFASKYESAGEVGKAAGAVWKMEKYLAERPEEAKKMPAEKQAQAEWWREVVDKAGVEVGDGEKILAVVMGEKSVREVFAGEEYVERLEGVEMVPLSEAKENYKRAMVQAMLPIKKWVVEHKEELVAGGALAVGMSETVRKGLLGIGEGAWETAGGMGRAAVGLVGLVGRHPIVSGLSFGAVLLGAKELGGVEVKVPKDPTELARFFKNNLVKASDLMVEFDLPEIPAEHWEMVAGVVQGSREETKKMYEMAVDMVGNLAEGGVEVLALDGVELVNKKNRVGLETLLVTLEMMETENGEEAETKLETVSENVKMLLEKVENGQKLSVGELQRLGVVMEGAEMRLYLEGGYVYYQVRDENGLLQERVLAVDPREGEKRQVFLAERFAVDRGSWVSAIGKLVTMPWEELRLGLNEVLFGKVDDKEEAAGLLGREMRSGGVVAVEGGKAVLYAAGRGMVERMVLGPVELVWDLCSLMPGGEEFHAVDLGVDWADGILPVTVFTIGKKVLTGRVSEIFGKRMVWETLAYPVSGTVDGGKFLLKQGVMIKQVGLKEMLKNKKIIMKSGLEMRMSELRSVRSYVPLEKMKMVGEIDYEIAALQRAKGKLARAKNEFAKKAREEYLNAARKEMEGVANEVGILNDDELESEGLQKMDEKIKELEMRKEKMRQEARVDKMERKVKRNPGDPELEKRLKEEKVKLNKLEEKYPKKMEGARLEKPLTVEETVKEIRDLDMEVRRKKKEFSRKRREINKKYPNVSDAAVRAKREAEMRKIGEPMGAEIKRIFERRVKLTGELPVGVRKQRGVEIPKVKVGAKGAKLKEIGWKGAKGLAGIAATMAVMYGTSELIGWATGENEQFVLDEDYEVEKKKSRDLAEKEKVEENHEVMRAVLDNFAGVNEEYDELFEQFSAENVKKMREDEIQMRVEVAERRHADLVKELKEFVSVNLGSLEKFYEMYPEKRGERNVGNIMTLGYDEDEKKVYLKHADGSGFRSELYKHVDYIQKNADVLMRGEVPDTWDSVADQAAYLIPGYGTGLDARDAYKNWERGNYGDAAWSTVWTAVGGVTDVLSIVGVGVAMKAGVTAVRGGVKVGKAVKVVRGAVKTSRLAGVAGKAMMGMTGADLLRPLFRPRLDEKYYF